MSIIRIQTGAYSVNPIGSFGVIHIGTTAIRILAPIKRKYGWRLELLTHFHWFRWSSGKFRDE